MLNFCSCSSNILHWLYSDIDTRSSLHFCICIFDTLYLDYSNQSPDNGYPGIVAVLNKYKIKCNLYNLIIFQLFLTFSWAQFTFCQRCWCPNFKANIRYQHQPWSRGGWYRGTRKIQFCIGERRDWGQRIERSDRGWRRPKGSMEAYILYIGSMSTFDQITNSSL